MIIGICGYKQSGKDTLGKYFIDNLGFIRVAFADPLKEACRCIFGFNDEQLYGDKKETEDEFWKVSPRVVLQYVGTDLCRNQLEYIIPHLGKDIWIESARKTIQKIISENKNANIVITDCRFPNEIEMIKKLGGTVIRITRKSISSSDMHASELHIATLKVDYEVGNDGTICDLYEKGSEIYSNIGL